MGDWWSDFTNAVGGAANWVGNGIGGAWNAVGQFISDTQAHAYGYPDAASYNAAMAKDAGYQADVAAVNQNPVSNYLSQNPAAAAAFNVAGGIGVGSNQTPVGNQDLGAAVDNAAAAYQPPMNGPANQGGFTAPGIQPSNQLGYTPIHVADPQPQPGTSIGTTPYDVTAGYTPTGSHDGEYWNDATGSWQASPITAPVADATAPTAPAPTTPVTPAAPTQPDSGGGFDWKTGAVLGAGIGNAAINLWNGKQVSDAEKEAAAKQAEGYDKVLKQQNDQFTAAMDATKPWRTAGEAALTKLGTFDQDHPLGSFQQSPDYAFRLSEGLKALQNSAGARGNLFSGATMKAVNNYAQDAASQEYGNWYARATNDRNTERNSLQSLAGLGQTATGQQIGAGQAYANNAGQATMGQYNALAGGIQGAANANASSYQTAAQTAMSGVNSAIALNQANDQYNALLKLLNRNNTNA